MERLYAETVARNGNWIFFVDFSDEILLLILKSTSEE
jgi:hypothetical protein